MRIIKQKVELQNMNHYLKVWMWIAYCTKHQLHYASLNSWRYIIEIVHSNSLNICTFLKVLFHLSWSVKKSTRFFAGFISKDAVKIFQNSIESKSQGWGTIFRNFYETKKSPCHFNYNFTKINLKAIISQLCE